MKTILIVIAIFCIGMVVFLSRLKPLTDTHIIKFYDHNQESRGKCPLDSLVVNYHTCTIKAYNNGIEAYSWKLE